MLKAPNLSGYARRGVFVATATGALVCAPMLALAQAQGQMSAEADRLAMLIELLVNVMFILVFGVILLIARRDMKGWNQPIKDVWFAFDGRLNRKAYWLKGMLPVWIIGSAMQVLGNLVVLVLGGSDPGAVIGGVGFLLVLLPYMVFSIWVGLALTVKRFHDLGSSGWWIFGFFIPFYNIWLGIKLAFFRGTVGPNSFGADPIDPMNDYLEETYGVGGVDDEPGGQSEPDHPHPKAPSPDTGPKGFGAKAFVKPTASTAPAPEPAGEEAYIPQELPGGDANLDLIKSRLGEDIMRPIARKRSGRTDS